LEDELQLPNQFSLCQNYPNPFQALTILRYNLPKQSNVTLIIFDMNGRKVKQLVNSIQEAGYNSVIWNATNEFGKTVPNGTYVYQMQAGETMQTKRMVLLK